MRIATPRERNDGAGLSPLRIALPKGATSAPLQRRAGLGFEFGDRRPPRRLTERAGVPSVSRIVLRQVLR
jgi:hypothetical protein